MKYFIASIRDRAVPVFSVPFFAPSVEAACRNFRDAVNRPDSDNMLRNHASDFDLFYLGTFDDATGAFDPVLSPHQISVGKDVLRPLPSSSTG